MPHFKINCRPAEGTFANSKFLEMLSKCLTPNVLLNKSQVPKIKKEQELSVNNLKEDYAKKFGKDLNIKQILKKKYIKTDIKKKTDLTATGNKKINKGLGEKNFGNYECRKNHTFRKVR